MPSTCSALSLVLVALSALVFGGPARATAVTAIDDWIIVRSGLAATAPPEFHDGRTVFYRDRFGDGLEPPSGGRFFEGTPGTYAVLGSYPAGAEGADRLALNSALGGPFVNAAGGGRTLQRSTLLTDVDPGTPAGLKREFHTFAVYGRFDLARPMQPGDGYGIALADGSALPATTSIDLFVRREFDGALVVRFQEQDFIDRVVTTLELDALSDLPVGVDQIELRLLRGSPTDDRISAAYRFWDAGVALGGFTSMVASVDFFRHNDFARANFFAVQASAVSEPASVAWVGLAALAGSVLRHRRAA